MNWSQTVLRHCPNIHLEILRKTKQNLSQDGWYSGQDSKQVPPEHKCGVLPLHQPIWHNDHNLIHNYFYFWKHISSLVHFIKILKCIKIMTYIYVNRQEATTVCCVSVPQTFYFSSITKLNSIQDAEFDSVWNQT
jgi:hypothetical protein